MPTLTLAIPGELKKEMNDLPELNWSEIAREAIIEKIREYKIFKSIVAKSKLTQKDALELGKKVNEGLYKSYERKLKEIN